MSLGIHYLTILDGNSREKSKYYSQWKTDQYKGRLTQISLVILLKLRMCLFQTEIGGTGWRGCFWTRR